MAITASAWTWSTWACGTKACNEVSIEVARGLRLKVQWLNRADHLVFVGEPAVDALEALAACRDRASRSRRSFIEPMSPPEPLTQSTRDRLAGQRIGRDQLGRGVAAAEIGDAQIAAEQVGAVEQQAGFVEATPHARRPRDWEVGLPRPCSSGMRLHGNRFVPLFKARSIRVNQNRADLACRYDRNDSAIVQRLLNDSR